MRTQSSTSTKLLRVSECEWMQTYTRAFTKFWCEWEFEVLHLPECGWTRLHFRIHKIRTIFEEVLLTPWVLGSSNRSWREEVLLAVRGLIAQHTVSAALCVWERRLRVVWWTAVSSLWSFLKGFCLEGETLGGGRFNKRYHRTSMKTFASGEPSIF